VARLGSLIKGVTTRPVVSKEVDARGETGVTTGFNWALSQLSPLAVVQNAVFQTHPAVVLSVRTWEIS